MDIDKLVTLLLRTMADSIDDRIGQDIKEVVEAYKDQERKGPRE